jgi:carbonic anhydrase/acetyltransferase-like protein (isoleucine patch superfamily)
MGSPAKVVKEISCEQLEHLVEARAIYQDLARRYLKAFREIP